MKDSHKLISTQIEKDIPQFIRMEYPNFVTFIVKYYEWMEQQGSPYHFIANALNFADVDRTSLEFLDIFGKAFLSPLPDVIYEQNNIATLVKNIEQYYSARGSEKAFQFLFRLFQFKEDTEHDTEFYYPSYDMLRVSDGKWVNQKSLKIIDPPLDVISWEAAQVTGATSGAIAVIDEVLVYESTTGVRIAELFVLEFDVVHTANKFIIGETINVLTKEQVSFSAVTTNIFNAVNITNPGKYYVTDQRVHIDNSGDGEDAKCVVDYVSKGVVDSFVIINGGTGYKVNDKIYTEGNDFGSGAYGKVTSVHPVTGAITAVKLIFGGHDYQHIHKVLVSSLGGAGAVLMIESDSIGKIESLEIRNFGISYLDHQTTIIFNTMIRIYDVEIDFDIGERITGQTSGAIGIIEYWYKDSGIMSIRMISGVFQNSESFLGSRWGGTASIYDQSTATGVLIEGCLCNYKGDYINIDGHISSLKYVQDSYFYQMFSYMLRTKKYKEEWVDYVKHVHPAGTIGFSYRDAISQYLKESYGGFIAPKLDTNEFYKFRWKPQRYHGGFVDGFGNTQIKQYADVIIDDNININNNILNKTCYTFGSEIDIYDPNNPNHDFYYYERSINFGDPLELPEAPI